MSDERASGTDEPVEVLRAKYYDFCSARIADVLLELSPDEIYVLAEEAALTRPVRGDLDYDRLVRLATEGVSGKLGLPSFEEWREQYLADPQSMDPSLLGLWRTER